MSALLSGCVEETQQGSGIYRDVTISVGTKSSDPLTANDAKDGSAFSNLLVIMTDMSNNVVARAFKDYSSEYLDYDEVYFERIEIGTYKIFAYANIYNYTPQDSEHYIENEEKADATTVINEYRTLKTLSGDGVTPGQFYTDGKKSTGIGNIILSGQSTMTVGVTNSTGSIDLLRTACRLNVYVNNHADTIITLNNLSFSNFNPSKMYLLGHTQDNRPEIPDGNTYRSMPSINPTSHPDGIDILPNCRDSLVYSVLLFENNRTDNDFEYRIYVTANRKGTPQTLHENDAIPISPSEISGMDVNDVFPGVLMVNPLLSNGKIMKGTASKSANFNGGNINYVNSFVKKYADNESFFIYIKKVDATHYNFYKDFSCTSLVFNSGPYTIVEGVRKNDNSYGFTAAELVQFKNDSNKYLYNNSGNFGVKSNSDQTTQWTFYNPVNIPGSSLIVVDNVTGQPTPLSYMLRNQELNVILNAYYNQEEAQFDFFVDNTYWTEPHSMTHTFR